MSLFWGRKGTKSECSIKLSKVLLVTPYNAAARTASQFGSPAAAPQAGRPCRESSRQHRRSLRPKRWFWINVQHHRWASIPLPPAVHLPSSGKRCRTIYSRSSKPRKIFYPKAVDHLNQTRNNKPKYPSHSPGSFFICCDLPPAPPKKILQLKSTEIIWGTATALWFTTLFDTVHQCHIIFFLFYFSIYFYFILHIFYRWWDVHRVSFYIYSNNKNIQFSFSFS